VFVGVGSGLVGAESPIEGVSDVAGTGSIAVAEETDGETKVKKLITSSQIVKLDNQLLSCINKPPPGIQVTLLSRGRFIQTASKLNNHKSSQKIWVGL
jgi:hypothetical protein